MTIKKQILFLLTIALCPVCHADGITGERDLCTYDTYQWNTFEKRAVEYERIEKLYSDLTDDEIDQATGCSVCQQDQVVIQIGSLQAFQVCHIFADQIKKTLTDLLNRGEPIYKVVAYRVGKSRGDIDTSGNRTQFSNHSFGIAIDINPEYNGLYDNCLEYGPQCRLIKGGAWLPGQSPESLTKDGAIVNELKRVRFKWGGEIPGKQKDFMHFSPSGY